MQVEWAQWPPKIGYAASFQIGTDEAGLPEAEAPSGKARATSTAFKMNAQILAKVSPQVLTTVKVTPIAAAPKKDILIANRIRPNIQLLFANRITARGVTRDKIKGLLSPVANPTDDVVFEDAANPQQKYGLLRYRLAEQSVSGKAQFQLKLTAEAQGGNLTAYLERYPSPKLAQQAPNALPLPHTITVKLGASVTVGTSRVQQELVFQEVTEEGNLVKAVYRMSTLAQLTQVFQVLTEPAYAASLIVVRSTSLAWPVPVDAAEVQRRTVEIQGLQQEVTSLTSQSGALTTQINAIQPRIAIPQFKQILASLVAKRTALETQKTAKNSALAQKQSELQTLQSQKLFLVTPQVLNCEVGPTPFVFPKELHSYIFSNIVANTGGRVGFTLHQVSWKERSHTYYQQSLDPYRIMFLPDCFKVARRPESPHYPMLPVRFPDPDAPPETMPVTLEYVAEPFVDGDRLEAAAQELKRKLPELAQDTRKIEFEPLLCDTAKLFLTLPRGSAGPQREEQNDAQVDLRTKISGAVTLPMRDFQSVYDAMFGDSAVVFQGSVLVALDKENTIPPENIPLICRLDDLSGEILDVEIQQEAAANTIRVKLTNATESPAEVRGLRAMLVRGESQADGIIEGVTLPVTLAAGESIQCKVNAAALPGEGPIAAIMDLRSVISKPDPEAVWTALVGSTRLPESTTKVAVKTIKQTFEVGADPVLAVVVDFEKGNSVDLSAEKLAAEAIVHIPLTDFVLKRVNSGDYRYKVTVIRATGQTKDQDWRTDSTGILFPSIPQAVNG